MLYFFIIPGFALLLMFLFVMALVLSASPKTRWLSGYVLGGTLGTIPGFFLANAAVIAIGVTPLYIAKSLSLPENVSAFAGYLTFLGLIIGPLLATIAGIGVGFILGLIFVWRKRRKLRESD